MNSGPPRARWRLPAVLTMLAALPLACVVAYVVYGGRPLWRQSLWRYAAACRRPLADVCTTCPTLAELDPDRDGRLNVAIAPSWSIEASLLPCGLGGGQLAEDDRVLAVQTAYFDRAGHLVALYLADDQPVPGCTALSAWYGPPVVCRSPPLPMR